MITNLRSPASEPTQATKKPYGPSAASADRTRHAAARAKVGVGPDAAAKMDKLHDAAAKGVGNFPNGAGYRAAKAALQQAGFPEVVNELNTRGHGTKARQFAEYFDKNPDRLAALGLRKLEGVTAADAPKGSIVVQESSRPGGNPGRISIADGNGRGFDFSAGKLSSSAKLLGVYVPAN